MRTFWDTVGCWGAGRVELFFGGNVCERPEQHGYLVYKGDSNRPSEGSLLNKSWMMIYMTSAATFG